jgi:signal transduction histidine kinase
MDLNLTQPLVLLVAGAAAFGIAALLWALRISDGARGAAKRFKEQEQETRQKLARAESVFGAHPGVIMVWEDEEPGVAAEPGMLPKPKVRQSEWGLPSLYGSPVALMGLLRFADDGSAEQPGVRILEGLADLEARDGAGQDTTLRERLKQLRQEGAPFSLTIIGPSGRFLEADGRTAGARAVLWITDTTIKGLEESGARARFEEARAAVARDPMAFLEMLGKAPFPAWRMSGAGKLQWVNRAYLKAVGAPNVDHVLDRQIMLDQHVTAQAQKTIQGNAETDDTRHVVVSGERRAMRVKMFPLSGGLGGMAFDITDLENARETLDKHAKAHDDTLNHVADAVAIFGQDRKLIFNNRAFAEMWGLDASYLLDKPDHGSLLDRLRERRKLPARPDYGRWRQGELSYYQGDKNDVMEDLWNLPDGRIVRVTRQRHPLGGVLLLFKDITDELSLKSEFKGLINAQKATLDNLREAVVVFGGDGRLRLHNDAFAELWELNKAKLEDGPDFDAVVDLCSRLFHDRNVWTNIKNRVTNPSPEFRLQDQGVMRTSNDKTLTWITQPLPNGATLIAFMDVTAARKVEAALKDRAEALEAADKLKTEFVQNVSYQLRSPLTTILGYAELLESEKPGALTDKQREQVVSILSAADHLSKVISNILDLAMIEAGRMELELSEFSLRTAIEEAVDLVISTAENTKVRVEILCDDRIGDVYADERRIKQVMFNLLTNALRFTGPGGHIKIEASKPVPSENIIRLAVSDNGKGIAPERQSSVFDSFTSGDTRGAGLGLALVRSFVELHGGDVKMKSSPGSGTSVICHLPEMASPRASRTELELGPEAVAAR